MRFPTTGSRSARSAEAAPPRARIRKRSALRVWIACIALLLATPSPAECQRPDCVRAPCMTKRDCIGQCVCIKTDASGRGLCG